MPSFIPPLPNLPSLPSLPSLPNLPSIPAIPSVPSLKGALSGGISTLNSASKSGILACLSTKLTAPELAEITPLLSDLLDEEDISEIDDIIDEEEEELKNNLVSLAQSEIQLEAENDEAISDASPFDVQDNIKSFKKPEAPIISKKFTNISTQFPQASNALAEDYPNTHGGVDIAHNWYKVNKTTGYIEFVHNSGCSLKIDRAGNVSIRVTGNLKWIVDKDFLINSLKNIDVHGVESVSVQAMKNMFIKSGLDTQINSGANTEIKTANATQIISNGKMLVKSNVELTLKGSSVLTL